MGNFDPYVDTQVDLPVCNYFYLFISILTQNNLNFHSLISVDVIVS